MPTRNEALQPSDAGPVERPVRHLIERLRAFVSLGGGDIADVGLAADELERALEELNLCCELKREYQEQHASARQALHDIAEEWAGAECGEPVHAQEAYAIGLAKRMYALAATALRPNVRVEGPSASEGPARTTS